MVVPIRAVGEYLKCWGITPQKPLKHLYEQCPPEMQQWINDTNPEIAQRTKQENAEIQWGEETRFRSESQQGRSYSPKGKTPVTRLSAKRASTNMISTVTDQGKVCFMLYSAGTNSKCLSKIFK